MITLCHTILIVVSNHFSFPNLLFYNLHMIIEVMNILATLFLMFDNLKIAYPNSLTLPIGNFYWSSDVKESINLFVLFTTLVKMIAYERKNNSV